MDDTLFSTMESTATFSACGRYRWHLSRIWDPKQAPLVFVMLNPSTADATTNDPTVTRCVTRARRLGFGGLVVMNVFAWRTTHPAHLPRVEALAVGNENDQWLLREAAGRTVVCAWGNHGAKFGRGGQVAAMLDRAGARLFCLDTTGIEQPVHPLYIPADRELSPYRGPTQGS